MKKFWERMGWRKPDEMERVIQLKAIRNAYYAALVALLIWSQVSNFRAIVEQTGMVTMQPYLIVVLAILVQSGSVLVLRRRSVAGDEEYKGTEYPLWKVALIVFAFTAVFTTIASSLIFYFVGMR